MITIYAEKPDVARKIAAAIGPIVKKARSYLLNILNQVIIFDD